MLIGIIQQENFLLLVLPLEGVFSLKNSCVWLSAIDRKKPCLFRLNNGVFKVLPMIGSKGNDAVSFKSGRSDLKETRLQ